MIEYYNGFFKIIKEDGHYICDQPSAVAVLARIDDDILFVKQYRPAVKQIVLELPAGKINEGEGPREAAIRELREETGYTAKCWTDLGGHFPSPGIHNEVIFIYTADDLVAGEQDLDEGEDVEVIRIPIEELWSYGICDGKTLIGLFYGGYGF